MTDASCHCGAVRFTAKTAPETVNACDCSICRRYGTLWAYYHPEDIVFDEHSGPTDTYEWNERVLAFHRCRTCGVVTHWSPTEAGFPRMGVNARLMAPEVLAAARLLRNGK